MDGGISFSNKMDENEEPVQSNGSKTLLVRHLPAELEQDEKVELLKYFGAESVRLFSNTGRMVRLTLAKLRSAILTFQPPFPLTAETYSLCTIQKWEGGSKCELLR